MKRAIREGIVDYPQRYVLIRQQDSLLSKVLQAVDFIAWSFLQRYERGNSRFYELIAPRIIEEEFLTKQIWETGQKKRKDR